MMSGVSEPDRDDFADRLRSFAREFSESLERAAERFDKEGLAERIEAGGEQVREFAQFAGQWLNELLQPGQPGDLRSRVGGPHPLDMPTEEQGLALGALASGRWHVKPGTNELVADDAGQGPGESFGRAGELRARDWITANGEPTELGHAALRRWAAAGDPESD
jgi:hypothetical protein